MAAGQRLLTYTPLLASNPLRCFVVCLLTCAPLCLVLLLQTCFGSVAALGRAEGVGPWGVTMQCKPGLQGFSLDLLEVEWQQAADLQQVC